MAYKPFEDNQSRYEVIKTKKRWTKEFEDDFVLSQERIDLIERCLLDIEVLDEQSITRLARLIRWASDEEVITNWKEQLRITKEGRKGAGPSKEVFVLQYGKEKGIELYNEYVNKNSKQAKEKSCFGKQYWINQGYSEIEAKIKASEANRERSKRRWKKVRENHEDLSSYTKSINPLSKEFHGYAKMTANEMEGERKKYLSKCFRGKDFYIEKYGEIKGLELFKERQDRRYNTMLKNGTGVFSNNKGSASSWSLEIFLPLCEWIESIGYDKSDIQMGHEDYRGERWIRDSNDNNRYHLYDFTFLPLNCIIEYHGIKWHPKEDGKFVDGSPLKISGEEKRKQDVHKKTIAENHGYSVLEIWSDENQKDAINKCKEFLISNGIFKIQV